MREIRKICIILILICLTVSVVALIGNIIILCVINSIDTAQFTKYDLTATTVTYTTSKGTAAEIVFAENSVKIKNSYLCTKRDRIEILCFIRYRISTRNKIVSFSDMSGEWVVHNLAYKLDILREHSADVDLDYYGDDRWYIKTLSVIFGFMGF